MWSNAGHSVDFLVDGRATAPYFPTTATIRRYSTHGTILDGPPPAVSGFGASGNALGIYMGMWRALENIGHTYDVILANYSLTAFPIAFSRTRHAAKLYYVQAYEPEYFSAQSGGKARVLQLLSSLSYRLPLKQIANSPIYLKHHNIKADNWIPPGIDEALYFRRQSSPSIAPGRPLILGTIGRKEPAKGMLYALEAFESLARGDSQVSLKIAYGNAPDGWNHPRAEVVIPENDAQLAIFYRSIDILLAPGTVQHGAPHYPVLEAMACGTPVVTTGYLPANAENAWIAENRNSASIADAVNEIRNLPPEMLRLKLDKAFEAASEFQWSRIAPKFLDAFSRAIKQQS